MEYLVETSIRLDAAEVGEAVFAELIDAERVAAETYARGGALIRLWRLPDTRKWSNLGLWEALDDQSLHEMLHSLPLAPWMSWRIRPLAPHPGDPAARNAYGD